MTRLHPGCQNAARRRLRVSGLGLNALEWGTRGRPALCFLHGGSAHAHWFDLVAPAFAERFHVVALDQRGHGESDWAVPPAYSTEHFVADLRGVLDALGWPRAAIVGHSMGGHNAMVFAARHPERVAALVVLDSRPALPPERLEQMRERGTRPLRRHPSFEAAVAAFRLVPPETVADPALLAHLARVGVVERDGTWAYRFDPASHGDRARLDAWPLLPRIAAPTLLVRGAASRIMPADLAERMRAAIPEAVLVEIPGAYHHVTLDAPAAVVGVLADFLSRAC